MQQGKSHPKGEEKEKGKANKNNAKPTSGIGGIFIF
jgi:hypothetical protein